MFYIGRVIGALSGTCMLTAIAAIGYVSRDPSINSVNYLGTLPFVITLGLLFGYEYDRGVTRQ